MPARLCSAFFPLSGGNLQTWPLPEYGGYGLNLVPVEADAAFGEVVQCRKSAQVTTLLTSSHTNLLRRTSEGMCAGPCRAAALTHCGLRVQSTVVLEAPPYTAAGPFAINFWAKTANGSEQGPQYLFSQQDAPVGTDTPQQVWGPDQVPNTPCCPPAAASFTA